MSTADFFARKLGQPRSDRTSTPPASPPVPYRPPNLPTPAVSNPHGRQPQSITEALAIGYAGTGADAARANEGRCPSCGSDHYFARRAQSSLSGAPAPRCFSCGFNGMYQQTGNQA